MLALALLLLGCSQPADETGEPAPLPPFEDVALAHRAIESGATTGKLVLTLSGADAEHQNPGPAPVSPAPVAPAS